MLECQAAIDANYVGAQDTPSGGEGGLDVLAQHVLGMAAAAPFDADDLYAEVTSASPYAYLDRETFDKVIEFSDPYRIFWNQRAYYGTQIVFYLCHVSTIESELPYNYDIKHPL